METLDSDTMKALAEVPPDVLRALKDVPAEVLGVLAQARPEKLSALCEAPASGPSTSPWTSETDSPEVLASQRRIEEAMKQALAGSGDLLGFFGKYRNQSWWSIGYDLGGDEAIGKLLALPDYRVAQVLSVLGSEVRLAILRSLLHSPKNAGQLVAELQLGTTGQAYHHLRELERAGYLEQRDGRYQFVQRFIRVYLTVLALASDAGAAAPEAAEASAGTET
jgi:DNA-binding transcriptional ArsR family regulator